MAFVRFKTVKGKRYYQVVRNYREDGKHKQEVLCHLGLYKTIDEAIDHHRNTARNLWLQARTWDREAEGWRQYLLEFYDLEVEQHVAPERERDLMIRWAELREEDHRLYRSHLEDYGPLEGEVEYHRARYWAGYLKGKARAHLKKMDELVVLRARYF